MQYPVGGPLGGYIIFGGRPFAFFPNKAMTCSTADLPILKPSFSLGACQRLRSKFKSVEKYEKCLTQLKFEAAGSESFSHQTATDYESLLQSSQITVSHLQKLVDLHKRRILTSSARFRNIKVDENVIDIRLFEERISFTRDEILAIQKECLNKRELLLRSSAQLAMRRKQLVHEVECLFPIVLEDTKPDSKYICACKQYSTIRSLHLPDAQVIDFDRHSDLMLCASIQCVLQSLLLLSHVMDVPLQYPMLVFKAKPMLQDHISLNEEWSRLSILPPQDFGQRKRASICSISPIASERLEISNGKDISSGSSSSNSTTAPYQVDKHSRQN